MFFVNCTQHGLTAAQVEEVMRLADGESVKFIEMRESNPDLFARVANTPGNYSQVHALAVEMASWMEELADEGKANGFFHLPIGSPAFNWLLAGQLEDTDVLSVFSHTERISVELEDGVKRTEFRFENFIHVG